MKKILITGASGFIGNQVVTEASMKPGYEITAVDVRDPNIEFVDKVSFVKMDIRVDELAELICAQKFHVVVHLACIVTPPKGMSREEMYEIDVVATRKLLEACVENNVQKFIITSSGAAYGYHSDNPVPLKETHALRGNQDFAYSDHKRLVEEMLAEFRENHPELKQLILRPGAILGISVNNQITKLFEQPVLTGFRGYDSPFVFSWDKDLVAYILEGVETDVTGQFNVAGDGWLTLKEIAAEIRKPCLNLPVFLVKTVLAILKPLGLIQYGPEQVQFMQYRPVLDNTKIKTTFKHQPAYSSLSAFQTFLEVR